MKKLLSIAYVLFLCTGTGKIDAGNGGAFGSGNNNQQENIEEELEEENNDEMRILQQVLDESLKQKDEEDIQKEKEDDELKETIEKSRNDQKKTINNTQAHICQICLEAFSQNDHIIKIDSENGDCKCSTASNNVYHEDCLRWVFNKFGTKCLNCKTSIDTSKPLIMKKFTTNKKRKREAISELGECSICLESLGGDVLMPLACLHKFHQKCLTTWFEKKKNCPVCSTNCDIETCTKYKKTKKN